MNSLIKTPLTFPLWMKYIKIENITIDMHGTQLTRADFKKPLAIYQQHIDRVLAAKKAISQKHNPAKESLASLASAFTGGLL